MTAVDSRPPPTRNDPALGDARRHRLVRIFGALLTVVLAAGLALGTTRADAQVGDTSPEWLDTVNFYRATAGLPPVVEEPTWTARQNAHARYIVHSMQECESSVHTQQLIATNGCPANPDATEDGALSGENSDVLRTIDPFGTRTERIHGFMERPYHAQWILDPALERVAFGFATTGIDGSIQGDRTTYQAAAVLDVLSGRSATVDPSVYPVVWPGDGTKIPASSFLHENPNPLANCPRSIAPTGLPIIIRFASAPDLTDDQITVRADGRTLGRCWFTSATDVHRSHPVGNALFIIPDDPLEPGMSYSVEVGGPVPVRTTFDVIGEPVATSFAVEAQPGAISVQWSPPFYDGGAPIEEYLIIAIDQDGLGRQVTKPANQNEALVGDLEPGRYLVRVHARNAGNRRPAFSFEEDVLVAAAAVDPPPSTTSTPSTSSTSVTTVPTTSVPPSIASTTTSAAPTTAPATTIPPSTAPVTPPSAAPATTGVPTPPPSVTTTMTPATTTPQPDTSARLATSSTTVRSSASSVAPSVSAAVVVAQKSDLPFTGANDRRTATVGFALALLGTVLVLMHRLDRRPTVLRIDG